MYNRSTQKMPQIKVASFSEIYC